MTEKELLVDVIIVFSDQHYTKLELEKKDLQELQAIYNNLREQTIVRKKESSRHYD